MEPIAEEIRDRDRIAGHMRIAAQPLGHDKPVHIGSYRKPYRCPEGIGYAAPVGNARQSHQKPAGHIGGFRAESSHPWAKRPAAKIVVLGVLIGALGEIDADPDDDADIKRHRYKHLCRRSAHFPPLYRDFCYSNENILMKKSIIL